jgi:hypothetical protein
VAPEKGGATFLCMKAQPSSAGSASPALTSSGVRVLMMYDDLAAGNRVMRVVDSLLRHCGDEVALQSDMWKFATLRCTSMAKLAAQDARQADVVIVSAHGSEELPEEVQAWFRQWAHSRAPHPAVLVALLDHAAGLLPQFDPARNYLEGIAREAGMEFVSMFIEQEEMDLSVRHAFSEADDPPPTLEAFCRRIAHLHGASGGPPSAQRC